VLLLEFFLGQQFHFLLAFLFTPTLVIVVFNFTMVMQVFGCDMMKYMKRELALHFLASIILFVPIIVLRYLNIHVLANNLSWLPLVIGVIIGTILPDVDHIIYVYYLRPYEVTSQRVMSEIRRGQLMQSWDLLSATRSERTNLIFHTAWFQVLLIALAFLAVSSSSSLMGRGLVIAFLLHLVVDEVMDLRQMGNLANWFKNIPLELDSVQLKVFIALNFAVVLIFGFLM
jgi:hypothetical protein